MHDNIEVIHKRNKLLLKIIWFSFVVAVGVIGSTTTEEYVMLFVFFAVGLVGNIIITYLYVKRLLVLHVMYIVTLYLSFISFIMISIQPTLHNYFLIYFTIVAVTLYHNYRPILLAGITGLAFTTYTFLNYQETVFPGSDMDMLVVLNEYIALICAVLIAQSKIGERMRQEAEDKHKEVLATNNQIENVLTEIKESVIILSQFNSMLHENVTSTGQISKEVSEAFHEVAKGVQEQTRSVTDISESMHSVDQSVQTVAKSSAVMREISASTANETREGNSQIKTLATEMGKANRLNDKTVRLMNELNDKNQNIGLILDAIGAMTARMNILAMNAGIEAARAGEHGRGFAVVAREIRQLAITSQTSTKDIANILVTIQEQTEGVTEQMHLGQQAINENQEIVKNAESIFLNIADNSQEVVQQAQDVESMVQALQQNSNQIVNEITTVTSVTEEASAAIVEILANVEEQDQNIKHIVDSFNELEELTQKLNNLAK